MRRDVGKRREKGKEQEEKGRHMLGPEVRYLPVSSGDRRKVRYTERKKAKS